MVRAGEALSGLGDVPNHKSGDEDTMRVRTKAWVCAGLVVAALGACGEGEPMGPEGGVAGNWTVSAFEDATGCGEGTSNTTLNVRIEQSGNTLTVTIGGVDYTGMLNVR